MERIIYPIKRLLFIACALLFSAQLLAQPLEVTDAATSPWDPINLITNVFLGEGLEVTNVEFNGDPRAVGYFVNAIDEIGVDRGVIMTTGNASNAVGTGADNPGSTFASANNNGGTGDPDLPDLAPSGQAQNDVAEYIISFVPVGDTLRFKYIWASEEYPEYACSSFNDVFGFFISGPGINGPYSNNSMNIALVPGTSLPVTIDNVHPQNGGGCPPVNEQYYNDNNGSANEPVYDGFTDIFIAEAIVTPCEEYTIRLVIGDTGDSVFDSGVFLEAKSFGANRLDVDVTTASLDGAMSEGCSTASVDFELVSPTDEDYVIDFTIFGDAENGVDYTQIPTDLIIPAGDSVLTLTLEAFEDGIPEGTEFLAFDIQRDICTRDTFYIYIKDNQLIPPDLGPDTLICSTDTIQLDGTINVPLPPPPSFTNTNDYTISPTGVEILSPITVAGVQPFQLEDGVIQSVCINIEHNWLDDLDLFLQGPNGAFMELSTDNGSNGDDYINTCFVPGAPTDIDYVMPPASGAPYTGNFSPEGVWSDLWGASENPTNGEWNLIVIDDANGFTGTLLDWTITFEPLYQIFYEWTPTTGLSCSDCPDPLVNIDTPTTYILRAYDSYGCEVFDTINIDIIQALPAPEVFCGTITADCITFEWNAIFGAVSYEVSLDGGVTWITPNGALSHEVCGLSLDETVTILVRAFDGCSGAVGEATCSTPPCQALNPSIDNIINITCNGGDDGEIQVSATGDFPPFEYTLDVTTNMTGVFSGLTANDYTVTITDSEGCSIDVPVTVPEPDPLDVSPVVINDVSCNGLGDGSATITVDGGNYPYTYNWDGGAQADSVAVGLDGGMHSVLITDALGCVTLQNVSIEEPDALDLDLSSTQINCFGDTTGTATVAASGGAGGFTYQWDANTGDQIDPTAVNLSAGTYEVVVTDVNGCSATEMIEVTEYSEITLDSASTDASCSGVLDGSASVSASGGGIGIFTYQWDSNADDQVTATASDLGPGTYSVTVTDLFGCATETTVTVDAPTEMEVMLDVDSVSCANAIDGTADVSVMGGTPNYIYIWSDGGPNQPNRDDLAAGPHTVTVTDVNGCQQIIDFDIDAPEAIDLELIKTDVDCFDDQTGTASVIPTGGSGGYSYVWDDAQDTQVATGLPAGTIGVTVTDVNGCQESGTIEVEQPTELELTIDGTDALCFGANSATATVTPTGGAGGYIYEWNDSDQQDTPTAIDLEAGTYQVIVTDANDCTATATISVGEAAELSVDTESTPVSCQGPPDGTATATPTGGTGPYTYTWEDGQDTQTAIDLGPGNYNVTVTDANDCEFVTDVELVSPEDVAISISSTDVSCNGGADGEATILIDTGTAPFEYDWSNGTSNPILGDVPAGIYTVTVTDFNGCETTDMVEITEPEQIFAELDQTASLCHDGNNGSATVSEITYGNTPASINDFDFSWSTVPAQNSSTAIGLTGGQTYTVIITDPNGCSIEETVTVDNPAPMEILDVSTQDVSCFEGADGTASVAAAGGTEPYEYQWDVSTGGQTGDEAIGLEAGTYNVIVTDANGCQTTGSATLIQPQALDVEFDVDDVNCFGEATGFAAVDAEGGVSPYAFEWSTGSETNTTNNLPAGIYQLSLTDANGCLLVDDVEVTQPEAPVSAIGGGKDVSCFGLEDGTISVQAEGGTPPYSYSLDNQTFSGSSTLVALEAGTYSVYVQDNNGCVFQTGDVTINEPDAFSVNVGPDITLDYGETVEIPDLSTNPDMPVSYNWWLSGPGTLDCTDCPNPIVDPMGFATTVFVAVTNEDGCIAEDLLRILIEKERIVEVPTGFSPNGDGENDLLLVHGKEGTEVERIQVFDRWGELLYQAGGFPVNQTQIGWDGNFRGQEMSSGVYIWYLEVIYEDGSRESLKGSVTLLR
ncbi:MAG: T9SS type B sorting domain-containing protein [Bacteroidetes bacterium]|nr:T9SS type B sorting domain-containing protein [Bacteroidota bacterium]